MVDAIREPNIRIEHCDSDQCSNVVSAAISKKPNVLLPKSWEPGNWDVICQRGKDCHHHVGNRRFRICIENHLESYINAKTRQEKTSVITSIVDSIHGNSTFLGGFIAKDIKTERWYYVDNKVARDKVGNALRDVIKQRTPKVPSVFDEDSSVEASLRWINSFQPQLELFKNPFETPFNTGNLFKAPSLMIPDQYDNKNHHQQRQLPSEARTTFTLPYSNDCTALSGIATEMVNTNNIATSCLTPQWGGMDLEPHYLGLLPREANSSQVSSAAVRSFDGMSTSQPSPCEGSTWNKTMLSESAINVFDMEARNTDQSQQLHWTKSVGDD